MHEITQDQTISITIIDGNPQREFPWGKELETFGHQIDWQDDINHQLVSKFSDIYIFINLAPSQQNISKLKKLNLSQNSGIIFISDENNIENKLYALEQCVDIFVSQPLDLVELNAYIHSLYRRIKPVSYNQSRKIKRENRVLVSIDNRMLNLSKIDLIILGLLLNKQNQIVKKTTLAQQLDITSTDYHKQLNTMICRLRKKLLDFDSNLVIQTIRETGYTYVGPTILIE